MPAVKKAESATGAAKKQPKSVFISAPIDIDTRPIRRAFEDRGIHVFSLDQLEGPGRSITEIMKEALEKADIVVAVVDPTSAASNIVFFELGYAINATIPTAVLITGEKSAFWGGVGIPYFHYSPEYPTGIDFIVQQILSTPQHRRESAVQLKQTKPLGSTASEYISYVQHADQTMSEVDLTELIRKAIQESGVTNVAGECDIHNHDLAVWSDDFVPWVGNPLAIEVKMYLRSPSDVSKAAKKMAERMAKGSFSFGLLIYLHADLNIEDFIPSPLIASISVKTLFDKLRTTSFGDIVRQLRNQRVHGVP